MGKNRIPDDISFNDIVDRDLLVRYLEYVLVDIAEISPNSARFIELAIENLYSHDPNSIEARTIIN